MVGIKNGAANAQYEIKKIKARKSADPSPTSPSIRLLTQAQCSGRTGASIA
jgi:hypothetical protein